MNYIVAPTRHLFIRFCLAEKIDAARARWIKKADDFFGVRDCTVHLAPGWAKTDGWLEIKRTIRAKHFNQEVSLPYSVLAEVMKSEE